jgi:hypothetical protein
MKDGSDGSGYSHSSTVFGPRRASELEDFFGNQGSALLLIIGAATGRPASPLANHFGLLGCSRLESIPGVKVFVYRFEDMTVEWAMSISRALLNAANLCGGNTE